jgi:hypothetical protein
MGKTQAKPFKKTAKLRGKTRAAQDWVYEHKYAITDLMSPTHQHTKGCSCQGAEHTYFDGPLTKNSRNQVMAIVGCDKVN